MESYIKDAYNFNWLCHISDIHIHEHKRHEEYQAIFKKLYERLNGEKDKKFGIVITGDFVDKKDNISTETYQIARDLMRNLAEIAPVIYITGNHDLYQNSVDKLEKVYLLSGANNIHYLRQSGFYEFGKTVFYVYSLLDKENYQKKEVEEKVKEYQADGKTVICLYHGVVDDRYDTFKTLKFTIDDTTPFNYTLLGDIHKHEFLKPNVAYPGSLIQQNFDEDIDSHGYIHWDLVAKKHKYVQIPNQTFFYTIYLNQDAEEQVEKLKSIALNKSNLYLRVKYDFLQQEKEIKQLLKKINFITVNDVKYVYNQKNIQNKISEQKFDTIDDQQLIDIFFEKHKSIDTKLGNKKYTIEITKDIITEIKKLHKADTSNISTAITNYKICELAFKNCLIFDKNYLHTLDFTTMENIIGILGNNAEGKTSVLLVLIYGLFGKCLTIDRNTIINNLSNQYYIKVKLEDNNGNLYSIERLGVAKKTNVSEELYLFKNEEEIKGDKKYKDEILYNLIGDYDTFMYRNVITKQNMNDILKLKYDKYIEFLNNILNIHNFKDIIDNNNESIKKWKEETIKLRTGIEYSEKEIQELEEKASKKEFYQSKIEELNQKIKTSGENKDSKKYKEYLEIINEWNQLTEDSIYDYEDLSSVLNKLTKLELSASKKNDGKEYTFEEVEKYIDRYSKFKKEIDADKKMIESINYYKEIIDEWKSISDDSIHQYLTLADYHFDEIELKSGLGEVYDFNQISDKIKQYKELKAKVDELRQLNYKINDYLEMNNPSDIDLINECVEHQNSITELKDKISNLENKKSKKENEKVKVVNSIKQNKDLIESLKKHKYNPNCEFCISNLTVVQGKQAENLNQTLEENLKDINGSIQDLDDKIEKYQSKQDKLGVKKDKSVKKLNELYAKNKAEIENNDLKSLNNNLFATQRVYNRIKQFISKYASVIENPEFTRIYEDKNIEKTISEFEDKQSKMVKIAGVLFNTQRKLVKIQLFISKYENLINSEEFKDIYLDDERLEEIKNNLENYQEVNVDEIYREVGKYQEKLNSIEADKTKIAELEGDISKHKKKITELENKQTVYLVYNYILSNDGIIQEKISFYTSGLLETMNKILKQYIEKEICLNANGWYLTDGNGKQISISSASNMEANILNMVVKTVLNTCIGNKRCNIFMIDEGWDSFSEQNVSKRDNIIYEIATHVGQLIIISHLENMKKDMKTKVFIQNGQVKMDAPTK